MAEQVSKERGSLFERGFRWDERFNRRLGVVAVIAGGGALVAGFAGAAGIAAAVAGGSFVGAETSQRLTRSLEKRRS